MRHGQALVEFAFILPLQLLLIVGMLDLSVFLKQDLLATVATSQGALSAAMGLSDGAVQQQTVNASQGVLRMTDVAVTSCGSREPGAVAIVNTTLYLEPISELLRPFWQATGRLGTPVRHSATFAVMQACAL